MASPSFGLNIARRTVQKDGEDMKTYTVYRVDYLSNKTVKIGKVLDRREGERLNNAAGMLRMAQKLYVTSSIDSHIFIIRESSNLRVLFEDPISLRLQQEDG